MSIPKISLQSSHLALPETNRQAVVDGIESLRGANLERLFDYPDTKGDAGLRRDIERITPNWDGETLVTGSATQALSLSLRLVGEGQKIALYLPSYFAAIRQAKELNQKIKAWETVDELEKLGEFDAIVLTSNHTPPSGISFTDDEKARIAKVVNKNKAWLIEDNVYDPLWFNHESSPIQADPEKTIRIGSFSKMVAPALRLGFIRASDSVLKQIRSMKITGDLSTSLPAQLIVRPALADDKLSNLRRVLHQRSTSLRQGLANQTEMTIPEPEGGPYLCLNLPEGVGAKNLQQETASRGLAIDTNEHQYSEDREPGNHIRLHCGAIEDEDIPKAIEILSSSIKEMRK